MEEDKLNSQFYTQVSQRMATEEATCVLSNADQAETGWVKTKGKGGEVTKVYFSPHPHKCSFCKSVKVISIPFFAILLNMISDLVESRLEFLGQDSPDPR